MQRLSNGTIVGTAVLALALLFMLFYCNHAHAQQPQFVYSQTYTAVTADQGYATANAAPVYWRVSWTPTAASACVVAVDSSANGSTWTAGGVIAGQTCTAAGNSIIVNVSSPFVRINLTTFTGTNVKVTLQGWATNPALTPPVPFGCTGAIGATISTAFLVGNPGLNITCATTAAGTTGIPMPASTATQLFVRLSTACTTGATFAVAKNNVATALTCTVTTGTTCSDTNPAHASAFAAGDQLTVQGTPAQATETCAAIRGSVVMQ